MISGIGIDAVSARRMERWRKTARLAERFFHPQELSYALSRGKGADLSLAARFAAKEAFGKALGTGLANLALKDIMVRNRDNGQPELHLFGTARQALELTGSKKVHISLTHEGDSAIAMVVIEHEKK